MINAKKKKNGSDWEDIIEQRLIAENIPYTAQTECPLHVGYFNKIDFEIHISDSESLYVHATQDFYDGTMQIDRFEHTYQMFKLGHWKKGTVFYCLRNPGAKPIKTKNPSDRQIKMRDAWYEIDNVVAGSLDQLVSLCHALMSKNKSA